MAKFQIVKFMGAWAIKKRYFFSIRDFIRYGDYWPDYDLAKQGHVIEFETREKAEEFLIKSLWVKKEQIT